MNTLEKEIVVPVRAQHNTIRADATLAAMLASQPQTCPVPPPSAERIARLEQPEYALMNVDVQHRLHPDKFEVPDLDLRHMIPSGSQVKLGFQSNGMGERMWCQPIGTEADGAYVGILMSIPVALGNVVQHGDAVRFWPCNILQVVSPDRRMVTSVAELMQL
jgi:hypothetical protein